jgi:hypothetical protein
MADRGRIIKINRKFERDSSLDRKIFESRLSLLRRGRPCSICLLLIFPHYGLLQL